MSLKAKQACSIFPSSLIMAKLASLSIAAAPIIPKAITLLLFVGVSLFSNELMTSMGKSTFVSIATKTLDLKGSAQLCFVFKGRTTATTVTGRLSLRVGGGLRLAKVLIYELIHAISMYFK
jgi:hypothetical protein